MVPHRQYMFSPEATPSLLLAAHLPAKWVKKCNPTMCLGREVSQIQGSTERCYHYTYDTIIRKMEYKTAFLTQSHFREIFMILSYMHV